MRFGKNFLDGVDEWIGRMDGRKWNKEWTMAVTMIVTITMKLKSGHR